MRRAFVTWFRARVPTLLMALGLLACSGIITAPDDDSDTRPRSIRVTPPRMDLRLGDTSRVSAFLFAVTGAEAAPEPGRSVTYVSVDPSVATVDAQGLVTAMGPGVTIVRAEYGALALGIQVSVTARPRIDAISGDAQSAEQGDPLPELLVVRAFDGMQAPLAGATLDVTVLSGGGNALAQVVADENGFARVQWRLGTTQGEQRLKVTSAGADSAMFTATATPGTRPMRVQLVLGRLLLTGAGDTTQMSAQAFNVVDAPLPAATFSWRSSADSVLSVSAAGLVTSVAPGTAYIVASSGIASDSTSITVQPPPPPRSPRMELVSGDAQTAEQGDALADSLVVRVLDSTSVPVANAPVAFTVTTGGGSVSTAAVTDADGRVAVQWTLGLALGSQAVSASATIQGAALNVAFTATATVGTRPARVAVVPGRPLLTGAGDTTQISAQAFNVVDAPLPAAAFTWRSSASAVATVDATGLVTSVAPGSAWIVVTSGTAADSTSITVQPPPPPPGTPRLEIVSGNAQTAEQGEPLADSLVVRAIDADGAPIANATIVFTVTAGGGSVSTPELTDANGRVAVRWTLGVPIGTQSVSVTSAGLAGVSFTATSAFNTRPVSIGIDARDDRLGIGDTMTVVAEAINFENVFIPNVVYTWTGGDPAIATLDAATGIVTAVGNGTVRFTATAGGVSGSIDITVGTPQVLPKLNLGPDIEQPAGLQSERTLSIPQATQDPFNISVRTLDATGAVVSARASVAGAATATVEMEGGTDIASYWLQAIEGTAGRTVTIIAEALGYAPDTMVVTLVRPAFLLTGAGSAGVPIPATGGDDPIIVLSVGRTFGDGEYEPMAVRVGGTAPSFTLTSTTPALALLRFVAGAGVVGDDQGPQTAVTFGIAPGTNSTSSGQFSAANIRLARTGAAGTAIVSIAGPAEYDAIIPGLSYNLVAAPAANVIRWVGRNGNWNDPSGWDLGRVPAASDTVYVDRADEGTVHVTAPVTVTKLVVGRPGGSGVGDAVQSVEASITATDSIVVRSGGGLRLFDSAVASAPAVVNQGLLLLSRGGAVGAGLRNEGYVSVDSGAVDGRLHNLGTVNVMAIPGTFAFLRVNGALDNEAIVSLPSVAPEVGATLSVSDMTNTGELHVGAGTTLQVQGSGWLRNAGTIRGGGGIDVTAGSQPRLSWGGTVEPREPGTGTETATLTVLGDLISTDSNSPTIRTKLGGTAAGSQYDQLFVTGAAELSGGEMIVTLVNGFMPAPGQSFTVMTHGSLTSGFDQVALPPLASGEWSVAHTNGTLVLSVVAAPPPPAPVLSVNPSSITMNAVAGGPAPAAQTVAITNGGGGTLGVLGADVQYSGSPTGWVFMTMDVQTAPATMSISLGRTDLDPGTYSATVQIFSSTPGVTPINLPVTLIVAPAPPPTLSLALLNTPLVGVSGTAIVRATLSRGAPSGGLEVTLASGNTGRATVNAPATVSVPEGATTADFTITGVSSGTVQLTASAPGYTDGTLDVTVSTNTISVPLILNVPYTRTASLPITLTLPAPAGGVLITIASGNPAIVGVATTSVLIPEGTFAGNAQLEGLALGQATVVATGPNLATGTSSVRVTAALDIIESPIVINAGFSTASVTTRLLSAGSVFPAPAGGIPLTWESRNPGCIAAPASLSIPAGLNSVTTTADYGGISATPCNTYLVVTSPSFDPDSVAITVNPAPGTSMSLTPTIGAGLSIGGALSLNAPSPAGGTEITLTSSDPTRLVLAPNATTVGTASITLNAPPGASGVTFTYSGIEGQVGTADIIVTAQRYASPAPATITISPLGVENQVFTPSLNALSDGFGLIFIGALGPAGPAQTVTGGANIRAGGQPVTVTVTSTNPAVALTLVDGVAATSRTLTFNPGQSSGVYNIRPVSAGTTTFTATSASAVEPVRANYPTTVTVTTPGMSLSITPTIGAGLSRTATLFAGAAAPAGGTVVTLTSSDPSRMVLSPDATTVGTASIDVTIPAGGSGATFWYAGIEGQTGTADITGVVQGSPAPYSNPAPVTVTIAPLGIESQLFTPTLTLLGGDGFGLVFVGDLTAAGPNQAVQNPTQVRAGGPTITITISSTNGAVAEPIVPMNGGVVGSPAVITIGPGASSAFFGIRPLGGGTTTFTATSPDAASPVRSTYPGTITVNQPTSSFSVVNRLGAGLARTGNLMLQAAAPAGGVVVTLTSSDPSRLVLAPDMATVGVGSIDMTIPAGTGTLTFTYAAIEGQASDTPVQITATIAGGQFVNPAPAPVMIDLLGISTFTFTPVLSTLAADGLGIVFVGGLSAPGTGQTVDNETPIRAGGQALTVTLTSTTPTVAVPVVDGVAASPATLTFLPGQSRATYGIRQLVAGTTTFTATAPGATPPVRTTYPEVITVTSPTQGFSLVQGVGAGLATSGTLSFSTAIPAGGSTVTLTSSDPTRVLLAPNFATAGAAQITIPVPQGHASVTFVVMGLEDVTGSPTITAQTPGYTDGTVSIAVQPTGVQWFGTSNLTLGGGDGIGAVAIGVMSGVVANRIVSPEQVIRFGGVARTVTLTSSNATVVLPVVAGVAQQNITVTLQPGESRANVGVRAVGAGTATIDASAPGLLSAQAPGVPQAVTVSP